MARNHMDGDCSWDAEQMLAQVSNEDAVAAKFLADGFAVGAD